MWFRGGHPATASVHLVIKSSTYTAISSCRITDQLNSRGTPWPHVSADAIKGKIPGGSEGELSGGVERSWQPSSLSHLQWDSALLPAKWMLALQNKSERTSPCSNDTASLLFFHTGCTCYPCERASWGPCTQSGVSMAASALETLSWIPSPASLTFFLYWFGLFHTDLRNWTLVWKTWAREKTGLEGTQSDSLHVPTSVQTSQARREWSVLR